MTTTIGRFLEHCGATVPLDEVCPEKLKQAIAYSIQTTFEDKIAPGRRFSVLAGKLDTVDNELSVTVHSTDCSIHSSKYVAVSFKLTYMRWSDKHGNEGLLFGTVTPSDEASAEVLGIQILGLDEYLASKAVKYNF